MAVARCRDYPTLAVRLSGGFVGEGEVVRLKAEAAPHFVFTRWDGNYSGTDNPIAWMVDQDYTIEARFASVQETLYVDDDAADDPAPGDATQSDPQEDGTSAHPYDAIQEAIDVAGKSP